MAPSNQEIFRGDSVGHPPKSANDRKDEDAGREASATNEGTLGENQKSKLKRDENPAL